MFGIGGFELFIILVFGFLIFGPDKLPEIAKTVGKGIARFREAQQEMNDTLGGEKIFDPNNPDEPFKNPVEVLDRMAQRQEEKKTGKASGAKSAAKTAEARSTSEKPEAGKSADTPRQESFTERKARYERERAARKAAEAASEGDPAGTHFNAPAADSPESAKADVSVSGKGATTEDSASTPDAATEGGDA